MKVFKTTEPAKGKKPKRFAHAINIVTIALIIECFLCVILLTNKYGKENSFDRIKEVTEQTARTFENAMEDNHNKLTVFAATLGANSSNTDEFLINLMENFCNTQDFSALCIHRLNGTSVSYGAHFHDRWKDETFGNELLKLPYTSDKYTIAGNPQESYVYQAVPIVRNGSTVGILYGYISLDFLPELINSTAYEGHCYFYIVDGFTGDFLMDQKPGNMENINNPILETLEIKRGYSIDTIRSDVKEGKSGYYVYRAPDTKIWYDTYYMPLNINNWSMQLSVDDQVAFGRFNDVQNTMFLLMVAVVGLMLIHLYFLLMQTRYVKLKDNAALHKTNYINDIQRALLNAHTNPDSIEQALKILGAEMNCETVALLALNNKVVNDVYFWPSKDKARVTEMIGRNVRDEFPVLYDILAEGKSVQYTGDGREISSTVMEFFSMVDIRNTILVPVMSSSGLIKGIITAINLEDTSKGSEMIECVTYDFFMTLTNVENREIIRNLATIDYMTKVKNRNSYEAEMADYAVAKKTSLWCAFIDVNGLHAVNNTYGHKAGDIMLCAVADTLKRIFGKQYTYRIGGDEFVAFSYDNTKDDMKRKKKQIMAELAAKGYHVSIGFEGTDVRTDGKFDVEKLISTAENIMYRDKQEFARKNEIDSSRNYMPEKPEII